MLSHPAVQGGVAPFVVGLIVAAALHRVRLGGLAVAAAFFTAVYFVAGFGFSPLTATRKVFLAGAAAAVLGVLVDFAFKPTRVGTVVLAVAGAAAALWAFWPLIAQQPLSQAWLTGGSAAVAVAFIVGYSQAILAGDGVRAGSAGLGLGLGVGIAAILAAAPTYGLYGISLGAGAGAFLLLQMLGGKKFAAGATFMLPAALLGGLVGAGAMVLAKLPWHALLLLALVPVGASLPVPQRAPMWLQAMLLFLYTLVIAGCAFLLARLSS
jgi:hypothetical protein